MLKEVKEGLLLSLKISPNSSKNEFIINGDSIKLKITAPPVDGKANKFLTEFLSKNFKIPKSSIEIVKGETSKEKTILLKTSDISKIDEIKQYLTTEGNRR